MNFEIEDTALPEIKIINGKRFNDERGFFTETYKLSSFTELGLPKFVQDNLSESRKGVIRGLHWQNSPFSQGKLVRCVRGKILDVVVDIRKESRYYGQYFSIVLNQLQPKFLWIPEGFAHGFQSLEDETIVEYKVDKYWNTKSEKSLNPLDAELNIPWIEMPLIISSKDRSAPNLKDI